MALEIRVTFWNGYYLDLEHILRMQTFLMVHWFLIICHKQFIPFNISWHTSWHLDIIDNINILFCSIFHNPILPAVIGFINFHPIIDHEVLKIVSTNIRNKDLSVFFSISYFFVFLWNVKCDQIYFCMQTCYVS